jgi:signal transduction histidine kinase
MELRRQEFDLAPLISRAVETAQPLAAKRSVHLENLTSACELAVNADRDKISRVLTALLGRAINSSAVGSDVSVTVEDGDTELSVQVRATGQPIERNEIHRIMNHSDWIKEQSGAAMGEMALDLRVAKELVELHGGRIWAESSEDGQNVLGFTVPKTAVRHAQEVPAEILT